ncbi:DNA polymerase-3 subunit alpha (Gram-positive type) [Entomoplasma freundtii]|uniref:DNA polymerase III PolC-type n=1 Tax=Entomoplasma freundtii TaxID=74700 RepID=A0A2K8NRP0_9MOLU|nr:PolC-type DNA polymerase III [Entomoplasma freundtii]ATZ16500.1 DNA polymerase III subunit alpha [Entomoplasma freundtii]TDY56029.1 DNA polymerase-3 subunit alpha (Gram-positive type) [Entomoplasma freundtii]
MEKDLLTFIEDLKIPLTEEAKNIFKVSTLTSKPRGNKAKKKVYFDIATTDFLPLSFLEELADASTKAILKTKFLFTIDKSLTDETTLWQYVDFIKNKKSQLFNPGWELISASNGQFNHENQELTFFFHDKKEEKNLASELTYLENKLHQIGLNQLQVKSSLREAPDPLEDIEKNYQATSLTMNQVSQTNLITPEGQSSKPIFKKRIVSNDWTQSYESLLDLEENAQNVVIHGEVSKLEIRKSKTGRQIYSLIITDYKSSIKATYFGRDQETCAFDIPENGAQAETIQEGDWVALRGRTGWSTFDNETTFTIDRFTKIQKTKKIRQDSTDDKRVELHVHTKMSPMDGVSSASDYLERADQWDWPAIAITDHTNVQVFPEAFQKIKQINKQRKQINKDPLKLIYGSEFVVLNRGVDYVRNPQGHILNQAKYVVFDLETTGLSPEFDEVIEFGASVYDYQTGTRERIDWLIKPTKPLKAFTIELTKITDEMLANCPSIEAVFPKILTLIEGAILVAHNATFDFTFLQALAQRFGYEPLTNTVIDTLAIARAFYPDLKNYRLGTVAKKTGIIYDERVAHRGDYDADVLTDVFERMWNEAKQQLPLIKDEDWNLVAPENLKRNMNYVKTRGFHVSILAKNQAGIKDLYKLVSTSHTKTLLGVPKVFKDDLATYHQKGNLLLGSGCVNGEIFDLARTSTLDQLAKSMAFYDYIEVQPKSVYKNLLQNDTLDATELERTLKVIIETAQKIGKLVVATSDAHYLDPEMKIIREVYINSKGLGGTNHPLYDFKHRVTDYPDQHLRTTVEMLKDFEWLGDNELIKEIVLTNPRKIANEVDLDISPVRSGTYDPKIENVDELLRKKCYEISHRLYGNPLPKIVEERLELELNSIIKHGFAVIYWISHKLVEQSLQDGYLVGSRGSVGSSFVARASEITEVNPLKAHYRCPICCYSNFDTPKDIVCGYDLPKAICPNCQEPLLGDGHDIPFETFLGFDGDKVPDIDLNFSGEYQARAHDFIKQMFGENNVFRAGTISTVADKTAFGYVKNFFEERHGLETPYRKVEIERLAGLATGVKRTTGQHPGGVIILPQQYEIEDFTPVNYPADDLNSDWKTTHFDFHSIHDNLLKMDVLGHVDPTALKMLRNLTGIDPITIPMNDPQVYSLFSSLEALKLSSEQINKETTGAIGLPEFGTPFVRGMLRDTHPKTFADLVQISGLSHGTDVWLGNAQSLIRQGHANISTVIGCRDDIMVYLLRQGLEPNLAFTIMESVRKGKGLKEEWIQIMTNKNVPKWYVESCQKIKYMFPKAHATAYVLMAYRIAWFKIYYPEEYYATFFSTRSDAFELRTIMAGYQKTKDRLNELEIKANQKQTSTKENDLIITLEVALEMLARGIELTNIDFNQSLADRFLVIDDQESGKKKIVPPFNVIDSLGIAVGESIVRAREVKLFQSINDLKTRTQVTQTQLKIFTELEVTDSLNNDEQLSFAF